MNDLEYIARAVRALERRGEVPQWEYAVLASDTVGHSLCRIEEYTPSEDSTETWTHTFKVIRCIDVGDESWTLGANTETRKMSALCILLSEGWSIVVDNKDGTIVRRLKEDT